MLSGGQFCSLLAEPVAHLQALEGCEVGSVARHEHQFLGGRNGGNLWAPPVFVDSGLSNFLVDHTVF
jgi:hypothetical protein